MLNAREIAIAQEGFAVGRIYTSRGEKESPSEINERLINSCTVVANRERKIQTGGTRPAAHNTRIAQALREIAAQMESWADSMNGDCRHVPQAVLYQWARQLRNA